MLTIILLLINSSESLQVTGYRLQVATCNLKLETCDAKQARMGNIVIVFVVPIQSVYFKVNLKIFRLLGNH